jgi:hypothetical protein
MKRIFLFLIPILFISSLWSFSIPSGTKSIEIDWGDGTPKMVIDNSEPYIEDTIKGDGWEQKIYYKKSWVNGNELLYYLDENKRPQHDYKTGGHYTRTITFKDATGKVLQTETDSVNIPDAEPIKASDRGIKAPKLKQPLIVNYPTLSEGKFYYLPGSNIHHQFTAIWDMSGITDPENYQLKRIEWKFYSPLSPTPKQKEGLNVEYNGFFIPSSSIYPSLISNDRFLNKVTIKYDLCSYGAYRFVQLGLTKCLYIILQVM